jgi:hypothetical protein
LILRLQTWFGRTPETTRDTEKTGQSLAVHRS